MASNGEATIHSAWARLAMFGCLIVLGASGCISAQNSSFYVQDSAHLKTVIVTECSEIVFRDIDSGTKAKRQSCSKRTLNTTQRRIWEKVRPEMGEVANASYAASEED